MVTSIPFLIAKETDDNDFLKLKEMANVHDDWLLEYDKNGIKIWSKSVPDTVIKMIKVWAVFSGISSTDLYNTLLDPLYRKKWDRYMIMGYDIGHLNHNNIVCYYAVSLPPLKNRDFILQTSWLDRGYEHYVINHSVCHKDHPPRQGFVRAVSYLTGSFIKCIPNHGCELSFVSQTDPQGIIPAWIVNKCTQLFVPKFVKQLEKAAYAYTDWKILNDPNYLPWIHPEQIKCSKISLAECVPSEEEIKSMFFQNLAQKIRKLNVENSELDLEGQKYIRDSMVISPGPSKIKNTTSDSVKNRGTLDEFQMSSSLDKKKRNKKSKRILKVNFAQFCPGEKSKEFRNNCLVNKPKSVYFSSVTKEDTCKYFLYTCIRVSRAISAKIFF